MNSSLRFLVPITGVLIGTLIGLIVGNNLIVVVDQPIDFVPVITAGIGAIVGYFVGVVVERQAR